jgi:hypothetical protein
MRGRGGWNVEAREPWLEERKEMAQKGMRTSPAELIRIPDRLYEGYVFDLDGTIRC